MNDWLFYGGLAVVMVGLIGLLIVAGRHASELRKYRGVPLKYDELSRRYRLQRMWMRGIEGVGVVVAMIGLLI